MHVRPAASCEALAREEPGCSVSVPGLGVICPSPVARPASTQTFCASVSLSLKPEVTAQSDPRLSEAHGDAGQPPHARGQGKITSWETGCGRPQSRQRNPGFYSNFEAPPGPCASPPRPGAGTPPPSAGEGGSARAWHSALSCQWSSISYCPPSAGPAPRAGRNRARPSGLCSLFPREAPSHEEKQGTLLHQPQGRRDATPPLHPPPAPNPSEKALVLRHGLHPAAQPGLATDGDREQAEVLAALTCRQRRPTAGGSPGSWCRQR